MDDIPVMKDIVSPDFDLITKANIDLITNTVSSANANFHFENHERLNTSTILCVQSAKTNLTSDRHTNDNECEVSKTKDAYFQNNCSKTGYILFKNNHNCKLNYIHKELFLQLIQLMLF